MWLGLNKNKEQESNSMTVSETVQIHLGIDVGTSFTKVCYRIRGRGFNHVEVVPLKLPGQPTGIIPTVVFEDADSILYTPLSGSAVLSCRAHKYLKMKVAGMWGTINRQDHEKNSILLCFFIAELLRYCKSLLESVESRRLMGKRLTWSAKICAPIGEDNPSVMDSFRKVYTKAWKISKSQYPNKYDDIAELYSDSDTEIDDCLCEPYPEVGAAVYSFLLTRDAAPGLYCYIDIGAGTLDCSAFHLKKDEAGASHIYVYSTKIAELGIEAIERKSGTPGRIMMRNDAGGYSLSKDLKDSPNLKQFRKAIQSIISSVLIDMRDKARVEGTWGLFLEQYDLRLGGGGLRSGWYRSSIQGTESLWSQEDSLRGCFNQREVPVSSELILPPDCEQERFRFAVAYGLTSPIGEETPIQGFPWEFFTEPYDEDQCLEDSGQSGVVINTRCTCNGANPDCEICGGWGYLDEIGIARSRIIPSERQMKPRKSSLTKTPISIQQKSDTQSSSLPKNCEQRPGLENVVLTSNRIEPDESPQLQIDVHALQPEKKQSNTSVGDSSQMCSLGELIEYLRNLGVPFENNRATGGGIWVYCTKLAFERIRKDLFRRGIMTRHYPHGRRFRSGEQFELDPWKRLR